MEQAWFSALHMFKKYGDQLHEDFDIALMEIPDGFELRTVDWELAKAHVQREDEEMSAPATEELEANQLDLAIKESLNTLLPTPVVPQSESILPLAILAAGNSSSTPLGGAAKNPIEVIALDPVDDHGGVPAGDQTLPVDDHGKVPAGDQTLPSEEH